MRKTGTETGFMWSDLYPLRFLTAEFKVLGTRHLQTSTVQTLSLSTVFNINGITGVYNRVA